IEPTVTLFKVFQTLYKQGDWFLFAKRRASSPVCIDDNRSCMKHWKIGFFLIDRRVILDAMVWRHPDATINDPRLAAGSFNMADVHRLSAYVIKLRDMPEGVLVLSGLSIHDFLCLPEWTGAEVQEEPHLDVRPTLQRLSFYCTPPAAADAVIPNSTLEDLATCTPSSKILAKAEASQNTTWPSLFASDDDESDDDDACVEILLVTPLCSATVIPSSGNQGWSSITPTSKGSNTRDSRSKGIMVDDIAAPSGGTSFPFPLVLIMPLIPRMVLLELEEPTPQMAPVESPQMVSSVKLSILKKGEYTLWSMRIEQYLTNTDYGLWQVIMNDDEPIQTTRDENGVETEDAKSLSVAIKSRFGGNVESKKMQMTVLKQQFEKISVSDIKGLDKAYDTFQKLISLLEVHGETVSNEDVNQKFLRALPSSWSNIALIMRNKEGIDELDIDDLYNNLKVFEADIKGSSGSSLNSHNVAFLFAEGTNSINEVNTANGVSTAAGHSSSGQAFSSSYNDDLMFLFFTSHSNSPQLDDEDLEQIDHDDLEEIDLKWPVVLTKQRLNALTIIDEAILQGSVEHQEIKGTGMEMQDGLGYDWSYIAQEQPTEFALIAYTSGSDSEGFTSVLAVLKPKRLKADRARMCEEASKVKSCPSEIILADLLALDLIVRFDFE
nr:hypothetical protein [Tanacetum cinerariifolium]